MKRLFLNEEKKGYRPKPSRKDFTGYARELPEDMLKRLEDIHHRYLSKKGN